MAYAGQRFASRLLAAMKGKKDVVECAFVQNNLTAAPFFSTKCLLGPEGVEELIPLGEISEFEQDVMDKMVPDLVAQAKKGVEFVSKA